jgi:hypothetical protein
VREPKAARQNSFDRYFHLCARLESGYCPTISGR